MRTVFQEHSCNLNSEGTAIDKSGSPDSMMNLSSAAESSNAKREGVGKGASNSLTLK